MLQEFGKDHVPWRESPVGRFVCFQCKTPWRSITVSNRAEFSQKSLRGKWDVGHHSI